MSLTMRSPAVYYFSNIKKVILPLLGAIGGMVLPAAIYIFINYDDPVALNGWAIPMATDIAFALGILLLLGKRVPLGLKVFLVSLAIFDDIGAIIIIALFYSSTLSTDALLVAASMLLILFILNRRGTEEITTYGFFGLILWIAVLKSGVHAMLAGILVAFFIPMKSTRGKNRSPLKQLEHDLDRSVTFVILPLFAFVNAGVALDNITLEYLTHPIPLGIALGLFLGKQFGIFGFCWVGVKLGIAKLPEGVNWLSLYGIALLGGIGFTMSLFVSSLSFEKTGINLLIDERLGIIIGSIASGIAGYLVLKTSLQKK